MTLKEMREKETDHLRHELGEQQKHLFTLRTQSVTEKLEDPSQLRKARRMIAQLKTILRQRQIEAVKSAKAGEANPAEPETKESEPKATKRKAAKPRAAKPKAAKA